MKRIVSLALLACMSFAAGSLSIGDAIVDFSMKNLHKKLGRGECWDLANEALNSANANWEAPFKFGDKVDVSQARPGDILHFTNVKFEFPFGRMSFPQHTAIVYKAGKSQMTMFHQNFNNKRFVDTLTIHLSDMKSGKLEVFRPKAKS